jgi:2-keto-3-deoxy-L-rhamnonate aldolase RhmA
VDVIYIGPQDLAISAGIPPSLEGALDVPEHRALMERIVAGAERHGLPVGTHTAGPDRAADYVAMGIGMLVIHRDVAALVADTTRTLATARAGLAGA